MGFVLRAQVEHIQLIFMHCSCCKISSCHPGMMV